MRWRLGVSRDENGFTIIESMVAVAVLLIVLVLTITPVAISMRSIDRSKEVTVAENLAQARIEEIRSFDYDDVGVIGRAPDGILNENETQTVEGRDYTIETSVEYVGSKTGLNVIPQGGDGVEGVFDPGVNYKYVTVTVTSETDRINPITMETIIAPDSIGALENIALVEVTVDRHEPYDPYPEPLPVTQLNGAKLYTAADNSATQFYPDVDTINYTICLFGGSTCEENDDGWRIHPSTIAAGDNQVTATAGWTAQRTIRIYQPASLTVSVYDDTTGLAINNAVVTVTDLASGQVVTNPAGDYTFDDLVPDRYQVLAVASGYDPGTVEVEVPGFGGGTSATASVSLTEQTFVPVDFSFYVDYAGWSTFYTAGATVTVTHATYGTFIGTTDENGWVTIQLPASTNGYSVTASTPWGHAPDSTTFNTGTSPGSRSFSLGKPGGTDRYRMYYGPPGPSGFYEYKKGSGPWVRVPANAIGRATFILTEDYGTTVQIRAYCSQAQYDGGAWMDSQNFTMNNNNKTWYVSGSCP